MSRNCCDYVQTSLLELLQEEHELISKINEVNSVIIVAKRGGLRTAEYTKMLEAHNESLIIVREKIKQYLLHNIGIIEKRQEETKSETLYSGVNINTRSNKLRRQG